MFYFEKGGSVLLFLYIFKGDNFVDKWIRLISLGEYLYKVVKWDCSTSLSWDYKVLCRGGSNELK